MLRDPRRLSFLCQEFTLQEDLDSGDHRGGNWPAWCRVWGSIPKRDICDWLEIKTGVKQGCNI